MLKGSSPLSGASIGYVEDLYQRFRTQPDGLDESWRCLFGVLDLIGDTTGVDVLERLEYSNVTRRVSDDPAQDPLVEIVRSRGHLHAALDPLSPPAAMPADLLAAQVCDHPRAVGDLLRRYCGTLSVETAHIDDATRRNWLIASYEEDQPPLSVSQQLEVLHDIVRADEFERFLGRKYPGKKRFGAEGAETVIPLLRQMMKHAAGAGVTHVVIATMHRGRLNIMANVLGRSLPQMLAEMKGAHPFPADPPRPGDVPYHLGHHARIETGSGTLDVTLLANPSHLEAVDPVALGRARSLQDRLGPEGTRRVLPIIIHTDASVIGQGVVAETLQLATTAGFGTGGTVHLVINNQIGFTTEPQEARSSTHCTGIWKATDSCILHLNGDDAVAAARAARLAVEWRQTQRLDAVVDLVCYRRNGHSEIDEPTFTQPLMYRRIAEHTPVAQLTAEAMTVAGYITEPALATFTEAYRRGLDEAYRASGEYRSNQTGYAPVQRVAGRETAVSREQLIRIAATLAEPPPAVALHPKMGRLLRQRVLTEQGVAWPMAEALAFGTLLLDGIGVRLTGQDVVRGAFSHRHFTLVDAATGEGHTGLGGLATDQAPFAIFNSPLSEYAVLGFEYGYSLERPDSLVIWEAQFGDFANGAQIILDQFVAASDEKWCDPSSLVILLPHGLEGQGPEHSSARLERFLQMAANGNIRIASPSTPANYFHLLRRQAFAAERKPLIVMSPKRLLRLPAAVSGLSAFEIGSAFEPVLVNGPADGQADRILLCSGKIAYELEAERDRRGAANVAVVRLEELYPFPAATLQALFERWPEAPCIWVQDEPANMWAWSWLDRRVEKLRMAARTARPTMLYVGRAESGSPAGSFHGDHDWEQDRIVSEAFEIS